MSSLEQQLPTTPAIVLVMIVRNESSRIMRCLSSLIDTIHGAVIIDTGSTDDTIKQVLSFFEVMDNTPLVLEQQPWKNFGHNRNEAMRRAEEFVRTSDSMRMRSSVYFLLLDADMELDGAIDPSLFTDDAYCILQKQADFTVPGLRLLRHMAPSTGRFWKCFGVTHEAWRLVNSLDETDADRAAETVAQPRTILLEGVCILDHEDGGHKTLKFVRDIDLLEDYLEFEQPNDSRAMLFLGMTYANLGMQMHAKEQEQKKQLEQIDIELRKVAPLREERLPKSDKVVREWRSPLDPRGGNRMRMEVPEAIWERARRTAEGEGDESALDSAEPIPASKLPGFVPENYARDVVHEYTEEEFIRLFGVDAARQTPELEQVKALMDGIASSQQPPATTTPSAAASVSEQEQQNADTSMVEETATATATGQQQEQEQPSDNSFSFAASIQECAACIDPSGSAESKALPNLPLFLSPLNAVNEVAESDKKAGATPEQGGQQNDDKEDKADTEDKEDKDEKKLKIFAKYLASKTSSQIFGKSLQWLTARVEYGKIEKDPNNEEVWYAKLLQGRVNLLMERAEKATMLLLEAYNMRPHRNESIVTLSKLFRERQMFEVASHFAALARKHTDTGLDTLFIENNAYLIDPWLESVLCTVGATSQVDTVRVQYMEYLLRRPVMQSHAIDTEARLANIADFANSIAPALPCHIERLPAGASNSGSNEEDFAITTVWPSITSYFDGELVSNIPTLANCYLRDWFLWPDCQRSADGSQAWLVLTKNDCVRFIDVLIFQQFHQVSAGSSSSSSSSSSSLRSKPNMCVVRRMSLPYKLPNKGTDLTTTFVVHESSGSPAALYLLRADAETHYQVVMEQLCFDDCGTTNNP